MTTTFEIPSRHNPAAPPEFRFERVGLLGGRPSRSENFRKLAKNILRNLHQCSILDCFKNFKNPALFLVRLDEKYKSLGNLWKLSMKIQQKNGTFNYFRKCLAANRAFGVNIIFLQQLFRFRGWCSRNFLPTPQLCHVISYGQIFTIFPYCQIFCIQVTSVKKIFWVWKTGPFPF